MSEPAACTHEQHSFTACTAFALTERTSLNQADHFIYGAQIGAKCFCLRTSVYIVVSRELPLKPVYSLLFSRLPGSAPQHHSAVSRPVSDSGRA